MTTKFLNILKINIVPMKSLPKMDFTKYTGKKLKVLRNLRVR